MERGHICMKNHTNNKMQALKSKFCMVYHTKSAGDLSCLLSTIREASHQFNLVDASLFFWVLSQPLCYINHFGSNSRMRLMLPWHRIP